MSLRSHGTIVFLVSLVPLIGCADGAGRATEPLTKGLHIVAGANVTDTAFAQLKQALIVEVVGADGRPDSGVTVRFEAKNAGQYPFDRGAYIASTEWNGIGPYGHLVVDTTDAEGRAAVLVGFGGVAGSASVVISAPVEGFTAKADYTVLPGTPARVVVLPADTAVFVGATVPLRASIVDFSGNQRTGSVEYSAGTTAVTVTADGVVESKTIARSFVVARFGPWADTTWISVVPTGMIAALQSGFDATLVVMNLDGSGFRALAPVVGHSINGPSWNPAGDRIVYSSGSSNGQALRAVDLDGTTQNVMPSAVDGLASAVWPAYSHDGQWIYFGGLQAYAKYQLWRVRNDGSGAEPIGPESTLDWRPSPSPDGTRLAYVTSDGNARIKVFTVATQASSAWSVPGQTPRWSPTRELIAFVQADGGALKIMNTDGANVRTLATQTTYSTDLFSWSPDGNWLVVRGWWSLELLNVDSGLRLPLAFTRELSSPAWRP